MGVSSPAATASKPRIAYAAIGAVVIAAAAGPNTIRLAQDAGAPSLVIIAIRLLLATAVLTPTMWRGETRRALRRLDGRDWLLIGLAGVVFALNLLLLFLAIEWGGVFITNVLRRTSTLWLIILETVVLGVVFTRRVWLSLLVTVAGTIVASMGAGSAITRGDRPELGILIALVGALCISIYFLIGRAVQSRLPALAYSWLVFAVAGAIATVAAIALGFPLLGYTPNVYGWIVVVTVVTQFLGHVPINVALRHFHATQMSLMTQMSVVLSGILAFFWLGEIPSWPQIVGSFAILGGVLMARQ